MVIDWIAGFVLFVFGFLCLVTVQHPEIQGTPEAETAVALWLFSWVAAYVIIKFGRRW